MKVSKLSSQRAALDARVDKPNGGIDAHELDLSKSESVAALADAVLARGGVDILINDSDGPAPDRPDELADVVAFLASERASYVTGAELASTAE